MSRWALVAGVLLLTVVGCRKNEGTYSASKKILAVYTQVSGWYTSLDETGTSVRIEYSDSRYMSEDWDWSNRKLTAITNYDRDGVSRGRETFSYAGGNLTAKENRTYSVRTEFSYDDGKLINIKWYVDGFLYSSSDVSHSGNKIDAISTTVYRMDKGGEWLALAPYAESCLKNGTPMPACKTAGEAIYREKIHINWTGDNITQVESNDDNGNLLSRWQFSYDMKKNPLCNFWTKQELGAFVLPLFGSKNNVLTAKMLVGYGGNNMEEYSYSYFYEGDFPTRRVRVDRNSPNAQYPREEIVTTEYIYK